MVASRAQERAKKEVAAFQSPSLRGSGRFKLEKCRFDAEALSFNPLHCGAVVASSISIIIVATALVAFQSPSLRGSGRFVVLLAHPPCGEGHCFNPLHCGAVVASTERPPSPEGGGALFQSPSLRGSGRF